MAALASSLLMAENTVHCARVNTGPRSFYALIRRSFAPAERVSQEDQTAVQTGWVAVQRPREALLMCAAACDCGRSVGTAPSSLCDEHAAPSTCTYGEKSRKHIGMHSKLQPLAGC